MLDRKKNDMRVITNETIRAPDNSWIVLMAETIKIF